MSRAFRIVLLMMLSLALPFQGAVAGSMYACVAQGAGAPVSSGASMMDHGDHCPEHLSEASPQRLSPQKAEGAGKISKCSVCAWCFMAAGLPTGVPTMQAPPVSEPAYPVIAARAMRFTTGVLERPPRRILG